MPTDIPTMPQEISKRRSRAFFFFGILGLLFLLTLSSAAYVLFISEPQSSTLVTTPKSVIEPVDDPLVSVVPNTNATVRGGITTKAPTLLPTDPKRGAATPAVTIIEFGDFECTQCASMSTVMKSIVSQYGSSVAHVWKDMPLTNQHVYAQEAAVAARCAAEQGKFWEYHDVLLANQTQFATAPWSGFASQLELDASKFSSCIGSAATEQLVVQSYFVGEALQIDEVPTYYINDRKLVGPQTEQQLKAVIDEELR